MAGAGQDYITLEELKATLELGDSTFADDDLERAITAASRGIEGAIHRRFWLDEEEVTRSFRPDSCRRWWIGDISTVSQVLVNESEWTRDIEYELLPLNAEADGCAFTSLRATEGNRLQGKLEVTGKWGWEEVPVQIKAATSIIAAKLVKRVREAPFGIAAVGMEGEAMRISQFDPDLKLLLQPFAGEPLVG